MPIWDLNPGCPVPKQPPSVPTAADATSSRLGGAGPLLAVDGLWLGVGVGGGKLPQRWEGRCGAGGEAGRGARVLGAMLQQLLPRVWGRRTLGGGQKPGGIALSLAPLRSPGSRS